MTLLYLTVRMGPKVLVLAEASFLLYADGLAFEDRE